MGNEAQEGRRIMTAMEQAFNAAGVFAAVRPDLIERARKEMRCDLEMRRRRAVRRMIAAGCRTVELSPADLEYAVRVLGARASVGHRTRGRVLVPGMKGWTAAGKR
jgi:hypothetical protein